MPFEIDTGTDARPQYLVPDWFRDMQPDADENRLLHDYAYHLIGAMQNPKMFKTVIDHSLANWAFLRALGEEHPDVFTEYWAAFIERWQQP